MSPIVVGGDRSAIVVAYRCPRRRRVVYLVVARVEA